MSAMLKRLEATTKTYAANARHRSTYAKARTRLKNSDRKVLYSARAPIVKGVLVKWNKVIIWKYFPRRFNALKRHVRGKSKRSILLHDNQCITLSEDFVTFFPHFFLRSRPFFCHDCETFSHSGIDLFIGITLSFAISCVGIHQPLQNMKINFSLDLRYRLWNEFYHITTFVFHAV